MEGKLREFKNLKKRENILNKCNEFLLGILNRFILKKKKGENKPEINRGLLSESLSVSDSLIGENEKSTLSLDSTDISISLLPSAIPCLTILNYFLYLLLWIIIYLVAVQLEFGVVYFILSSLLFIYFNTRTGPKKKDEISAYSVFNPDCRSIQGTLKAEQFEREFSLIQHK